MEISIIIPVYNKKRYLHKLLEMVAVQSFRDFECLLIDDGSTDGSGEICDTFAEKDCRFQTVHIPNGGVSNARNVGLKRAKGRYITFIDGDDEISENYLENLYKCITAHNADMVISCFTRFWDSSNKKETLQHPFNGLYTLKELLPSFASLQKEYGLYGWCTAKLFPADLVKDVRFDTDLRLAEDFDFYLRLYPKLKTVYFDDKPYYYYRQEAENSSMLLADDDIDYLAQLKINLRYRDFLKQMDSYKDNNKTTVNRLLCNYVYFSLFHCPKPLLSDRFDRLYTICKDEEVKLSGKGCFQRWILFTVKIKAKYIAKWTIMFYRFLRKVKNDFCHHTNL